MYSQNCPECFKSRNTRESILNGMHSHLQDNPIYHTQCKYLSYLAPCLDQQSKTFSAYQSFNSSLETEAAKHPSKPGPTSPWVPHSTRLFIHIPIEVFIIGITRIIQIALCTHSRDGDNIELESTLLIAKETRDESKPPLVKTHKISSSTIPANHNTKPLNILQIQWFGILLVLPAVGRSKILPLDENCLKTLSSEIKFPTNRALLPAIRSLRQNLVLERQGIQFAICSINHNFQTIVPR